MMVLVFFILVAFVGCIWFLCALGNTKIPEYHDGGEDDVAYLLKDEWEDLL
jgi:hypothetical protein